MHKASFSVSNPYAQLTDQLLTRPVVIGSNRELFRTLDIKEIQNRHFKMGLKLSIDFFIPKTFHNAVPIQ